MHNFRSIKDTKFNLRDYSVLLGTNNSGKSNILSALRIFYEENKIKFNKKTDYPKFETDDNESWVEIEYELTDDEFKNLKDDYKGPDNTLKVRKFFISDIYDVESNQSNIYAYENNVLSKNLFYGAKNISKAKLGKAIYIPDVFKVDDTLKLSGPSPLREIIKFVMGKVIKSSPSFENLNESFENFNNEFGDEYSKDGFSLNELTKDINENLKEWEIEFNLDINPIKLDNIIKNLVKHDIIDKNLNESISVNNFGQGLQRHLIYTFLRLSSSYSEKKILGKKDFSPEFTLILFEEPEAFLHPQQQESLNSSLEILSKEDEQQIIISTHSSTFISKNIEEITSLIKLKKHAGITNTCQVSEQTSRMLIQQNSEFFSYLETKSNDSSVDQNLRNIIKRRFIDNITPIQRIEEESMRYLLWLDTERCCAFFADSVLICEGATEKVLIEYLIKNEWNWANKKLYVLDALGKFNVHRYMNLFNELGIQHSILIDTDNNEGVHLLINKFLENQKNPYTKKIDYFNKDVENFLGIETPSRRDKKPLNVLWHCKKNKIPDYKINYLEYKINKLI
ncbi:AAA family ATPase [Methanobacterium sp. YSL]|nr:AAA family ATPase [Methanobacterium sp. YSL]